MSASTTGSCIIAEGDKQERKKYKKCKNVEGETQERKIPKIPEKQKKYCKGLYALTVQEEAKKRDRHYWFLKGKQ